jgi:hypothetical protein
MLMDLGYEGNHVRGKDLTAVICRRRCKEGGTGYDAMKASAPANVLANVLSPGHGGGSSKEPDPGNVLPPVIAAPAEEGGPFSAQMLALLGCT